MFLHLHFRFSRCPSNIGVLYFARTPTEKVLQLKSGHVCVCVWNKEQDFQDIKKLIFYTFEFDKVEKKFVMKKKLRDNSKKKQVLPKKLKRGHLLCYFWRIAEEEIRFHFKASLQHTKKCIESQHIVSFTVDCSLVKCKKISLSRSLLRAKLGCFCSIWG